MHLEQLLKALSLLQDGRKYVAAVKTILQAKDCEIIQKAAQSQTAAKALKNADDRSKVGKERLQRFLEYLGIDADEENLDAALAAVKNAQKGGDEILLKLLEIMREERRKDKEEFDAGNTEGLLRLWSDEIQNDEDDLDFVPQLVAEMVLAIVARNVFFMSSADDGSRLIYQKERQWGNVDRLAKLMNSFSGGKPPGKSRFRVTIGVSRV